MGTFDKGHIKLYRKMLNWEWYDETNTVRVFIHCLLRANWKDEKWRGITVKRGSFITSRQKLAKELKMSEREIRTAIEHLESTNEVTKSGNAKYTVITVVKYDEYQTNDQVNDQQTTDKSTSKSTNYRPTTDQLPTTNEESNKVIREELKKKTDRPEGVPKSAEFIKRTELPEWKANHKFVDGWRLVPDEDGNGWVYLTKAKGKKNDA